MNDAHYAIFNEVTGTSEWNDYPQIDVWVPQKGKPAPAQFKATVFSHSHFPGMGFVVFEGKVYALFKRQTDVPPVMQSLYAVEITEKFSRYGMKKMLPEGYNWFPLPSRDHTFPVYALLPEHGKPVFFEELSQVYTYLAFQRSPELFLSKLDNSEFLKLLVAQEVELFHAGL